ncbi:MAG: DUF4252 domain-containing protein [Terriglobia bacterium]
MNFLNLSPAGNLQIIRTAIGWLACGLFAVGLAAPRTFGQTAKLNLDRLTSLEKRASEVTDVTLDGKMLRMASGFISDEKSSDDAETKALIQGLKGIYVRDYEFEKEGQYTRADLDAIRAQLHTPVWSKIVNVRSRRNGETDEIYIMGSSDNIQGLAILCAQPKELTVVNIVGPIDLKQLSHLEGHLGVPHVELSQSQDAATQKGGSDGKTK